MKNTKTGIARILSAFRYSFDGFIAAFKSEEALREDVYLSLVLIPIVIFIRIDLIEKILLFSSVFFVIFAELINTAIEVIIDRISNDFHLLSKKAKDIGSCLVLISFVYLIVIWSLILYENFVV